MITWLRALSVTKCGSCRNQIRRNDVMLEVRIGTLHRRRCETCGVALYRTAYGYGPVPPVLEDLPPAPAKPQRVRKVAPASPFERPLVPRPPRQPEFVSIGTFAKGRKAEDFKQRQAGEEG